MRNYAKISLVVVFLFGLVISCTPESLKTNDLNIELVDKDKNVRPGSQGNNNDTDVAETDTGGGN